jgi:hypothetical protein
MRKQTELMQISELIVVRMHGKKADYFVVEQGVLAPGYRMINHTVAHGLMHKHEAAIYELRAKTYNRRQGIVRRKEVNANMHLSYV